jgi:hypothetical protein
VEVAAARGRQEGVAGVLESVRSLPISSAQEVDSVQEQWDKLEERQFEVHQAVEEVDT